MTVYTALGDSITAGYGVPSKFSFPALYADFLRRKCPALRLLNLGINGLTTKGLLTLLQSNQKLRLEVSRASLITLTIGSNDLLQLIKKGQPINPAQLPLLLNSFGCTFSQIGEEIRCLNSSAAVKVATLYNPLPAGPYHCYSGAAQEILNQVNCIIVVWANRFRAEIIDLDRVIRGKEQLLIGLDYAHPNAAGHQAIAKAFAR